MKLLSYSFAILFLGFIACKGPQPTQSTPLGQNIGASITNPNPVDMTTLITQVAKEDTVKTQLKAKVEGVCQTKGCWMNLVSSEGNTSESIFVKFKDYGFFMPLDLAGSEVIVDGIAYKEVTSVEELRHYAEDEGQTPEEIAKITEPVQELKFMADGVIVLEK